MKSKMNGDVNEFSNPNQGWKKGGGRELLFHGSQRNQKKKWGEMEKTHFYKELHFSYKKLAQARKDGEIFPRRSVFEKVFYSFGVR